MQISWPAREGNQIDLIFRKQVKLWLDPEEATSHKYIKYIKVRKIVGELDSTLRLSSKL